MPGQVVRLKSGGPRMTIEQIGDFSAGGFGNGPKNGAKCSWFDASGKRHIENFSIDSLKRAD
ncbi:DUF2158 domain-containing protein [Pseudomonas sp. H26/SER47-MNA-CIBAN-0231]|uniref:YodC family protein n=1 Tax=Pseudomonas sp. H26/SER47-MNA-CIBAN-0231 TaxID=3140477 RepID=UPI00331D26F3